MSKNSQFLSDLHETWAKYLADEINILAKFCLRLVFIQKGQFLEVSTFNLQTLYFPS